MEFFSSTRDRLIQNYFFEQLENEIGLQLLIERIFERGTPGDIQASRKYYGDEKIKKEVVTIQWLSKETLNFLSGLYDIPKENFLTYQLIFNLNK